MLYHTRKAGAVAETCPHPPADLQPVAQRTCSETCASSIAVCSPLLIRRAESFCADWSPLMAPSSDCKEGMGKSSSTAADGCEMQHGSDGSQVMQEQAS